MAICLPHPRFIKDGKEPGEVALLAKTARQTVTRDSRLHRGCWVLTAHALFALSPWTRRVDDADVRERF